MKKLFLTLTVLLIICGAFAYSKLTIFVIQPIGAIPEGKTILIERTGKLNFIDSADAICERIQGGVSLLCRGAILGQIAKNKMYLRLPYSETLYLMSTGGKTYGK